MSDPRAVGDKTYTYKEVTKAFKAWGWSFVAEGVKVAQFTRDGQKLGVKRLETFHNLMPILVETAKIDGKTVDEWMKGPPEKKKETLSEDDIEWWLSCTTLTEKLDEPRYKRIRDKMEKEGTLNRYIKIRVARQAEVEQTAKLASPGLLSAPPEPPPVKVDTEGYISLDEALALVDRKQNTLGQTACEIIAVLSEGEVHHVSGAATRELMKQMKSQPEATGYISTMLKEFTEKGLVWRDINGKRTFKIGLCMPVRLLQLEKEKYLHNPQPVEKAVEDPPVVSSEISYDIPNPYDRPEGLEDMEPHDIVKTQAPMPSDSILYDKFPLGPIVPGRIVAPRAPKHYLNDEMEKLEQEIAERQAQVESLRYAIKVLEEHGS